MPSIRRVIALLGTFGGLVSAAGGIGFIVTAVAGFLTQKLVPEPWFAIGLLGLFLLVVGCFVLLGQRHLAPPGTARVLPRTRANPEPQMAIESTSSGSHGLARDLAEQRRLVKEHYTELEHVIGSPPPRRARDSGFTVEPQVTGQEVTLRVTNREQRREFIAQVINVAGNFEPRPRLPINLVWLGSMDERRVIGADETQLLMVADCDGMGNLRDNVGRVLPRAGVIRLFGVAGVQEMCVRATKGTDDICREALTVTVKVSADSVRDVVLLRLSFLNENDPRINNLRVAAESVSTP